MALVVVAVSYIYIRSHLILNQTFNIPLTEVTVPTDSASVAEGFRQTRLMHCNGCHGENFEGQIIVDDDKYGRIVSANASQVVKTYSDAELYRLIRHGVKKDGKMAFPMPADCFYQLKETSVLNIIAYLRTLEEQAHDLPVTDLHFLAHMTLALKMYEPEQVVMNHDDSRILAERTADGPVAFGNYLTRTSCTHCHGPKLEGDAMMGSPDLSIIALYSNEDFRHFFRTGEPVGKPDAGEMTIMAQKCFKYFTDEEVDAIYVFLKNRLDHIDASITKN